MANSWILGVDKLSLVSVGFVSTCEKGLISPWKISIPFFCQALLSLITVLLLVKLWKRAFWPQLCIFPLLLPEGYVTHFFFLLRFFLLWTILNIFIELLQCCFYCMFWFSGHEACGIWPPRLETELAPAPMEGKVSITRSPGKSC